MQLTEKRRYWFEHIKSWETSGLKQSEYCRREGLHARVFSEYKRQYSRYRLLESDAKSNFKAVEISGSYTEGRQTLDITISLPNETKLSVGNESSIEAAVKLTQALLSC